MSSSNSLSFAKLSAIYFALLALTSVLVGTVAFMNGMQPTVALATAAIPLGILGLFGGIFLFRLKRSVLGPLANAGNQVQAVLDGHYDQDDETELERLPHLGAHLVRLIASYKDRLGFSNSILQGLPTPVCIVDTNTKITFLNRECLQMIGSKEDPESYYGRSISQIFYKDDRRSKIADCMQENKRNMNLPAVFVHRDGSDINVLANLFPLTDVTGNVIGGCCLYLDTTELKKREAEILGQNERIGTMAREATAISEDLANAAEQLERLVSQAQGGTCAQTERTSETASAMDQMNSSVLEVARHAQLAATDAEEARSKADEGAGIVASVVNSIKDVASRAESLRDSMEELEERAGGIGKVLSVIEDIADQTNLLALNAAIEAARAGEAGRGFAVVADEVRKLAEKTMQATNEVHGVITGIQESARKNAEAMEGAVQSVRKSTDLAGQSGKALESIVSVAEQTADRVRSIATAAEEQSAASEEINRATTDVTRICDQTDSLMGDASQAISKLSGLSQKLRDVIREMQ